MKLFGKKKENKEQLDSDDLDNFDIIDNDDVFKSSVGAEIGYDDDDDFLDDDEYQDYLSESEEEPSKESKSSSGKFILVIGFVAIVAAILYAVFTMGGVTNNADNGQETSSVQQTGEGIVVNETVGESYIGNDNGNPTNGTGAILAFDYDYYVSRDGEKARGHFNPEAKSYDAAFIQGKIDEVPQGTEYELKITPVEIGSRYDVVLTLSFPGKEPTVYNQDFEVMENDGEFYVKTFTSEFVNE